MAQNPHEYDFNAMYSESTHVPTARCGTCGKEKPRYDLEERYSFGVYAGRYCDDACWARSGYRDATDPEARFDPADAGEAMEPEDY
jgi:hypothetical protein